MNSSVVRCAPDLEMRNNGECHHNLREFMRHNDHGLFRRGEYRLLVGRGLGRNHIRSRRKLDAETAVGIGDLLRSGLSAVLRRGGDDRALQRIVRYRRRRKDVPASGLQKGNTVDSSRKGKRIAAKRQTGQTKQEKSEPSDYGLHAHNKSILQKKCHLSSDETGRLNTNGNLTPFNFLSTNSHFAGMSLFSSLNEAPGVP